MKNISSENFILIPDVRDLDLEQTLDCGQSFRWTKQDDGSFSGVAFGKYVNISLDGTDMVIKNAAPEDEKIWREYFDLELDYGKIRGDISKLHPVLEEAARYAPGIRILRQEPYEALCTFIISQNNNIKRIKGIVARLCESFGDEIDEGVYTFPNAERLAELTPDDLAPLRAGFRNRYIIDSAKKVASGEVDLELCKTADYEAARAELMKITGVGVKVADCTLLFGMHRVEAFPVDVWMKRAMEKLFPGMSANDFGEYAGIAQQYIFHYSRMHPELFE
ncbi:DNA-3-methyladenine glycosylase family protein [Ruminococcus sp. JL13D9]|uniref:DNA-3-methyladenine glycosylase family protein n=1 Tax=Ruminococcus sp. JL13D9 TaxID=3233381 RepID=UPI003899CFDC